MDAYLSGAAATMDEGVVKIEITFEDEAGEATTVEKEMNLYVSEPFYPEMDMDMMADPMVEESGGFKLWYVLVPLAVVIVAVIVFVVIRFRKKKKAQAEEIAALDDELGGLDDVSLDDDNIDDGMEEADGDETGSKEKE